MKKNAIGLILARGGSKGIPLKNIRLLHGRPLLHWTLRAMIDSKVAKEVWVSTDHDEIARIARQGGAKVHWRAADVSRDSTPSIASVLEFVDVQKPDCDVLVRAQATAPCIRPEHYREMMDKYVSGSYDSMFTVTRRRHCVRWKEVDYPSATAPLEVEDADLLYETGAVYVTSMRALLETKTSQGGDKVGYYEMPEHLSVDIDDPDDWLIAEEKVRQYGYDPSRRQTGIKLLVCSVEGTLTDGKVLVANDGTTKRTYDEDSIRRVKGMEVDVRFIASNDDNANVIKSEIALDKLTRLDEWRRASDITWEQVAYIGSDLLDLECIERAGIGAAPNDAELAVKLAADYVAPTGGGHGAVSAFCNYLIETHLLSTGEGKEK